MNKWELIKLLLEDGMCLCEANGSMGAYVVLSELYELADSIDAKLNEIYGKQVEVDEEIRKAIENFYFTEHQRFSFRDVFFCLAIVQKLASSHYYCIACQESKLDCSKCKFAKEVGRCGDKNSLFGKFADKLDQALKVLK